MEGGREGGKKGGRKGRWGGRKGVGGRERERVKAHLEPAAAPAVYTPWPTGRKSKHSMLILAGTGHDSALWGIRESGVRGPWGKRDRDRTYGQDSALGHPDSSLRFEV